MHKRFIIIHPSEIYRKGLQSILRDGFDVDFILLENLNQLNDYAGINNSNLVLFIEYQWIELFVGKFQFELEKKNNKVIYFGLQQESIGHTQQLHALMSGDEIKNKIKKTLIPQEIKNSGITELSEREVDVLRLVALGHSNKDIAEKLFISIHTVITHRKHITEKLGIKSISGLTVYAILNKLIDTDNIDPSSLI